MLLLFITSLTLPGISGQGDRIFYHDAYSLSMGGVSAVCENSCNPAAMGLIEYRSVYASGWFVVQNERRGLRVYDSFGNNIGISTVTNNTSTKVSAGPAAIIIPFKALRFGLLYAPVWDYSYFYRYEQRDDFYQLIRIDEEESRGHIYAFSPRMSLTYKWINIGFEYGFMHGTWHREERVVIPQMADSVDEHETDFSGNRARVGVAVSPSVNLRFAFTYQPRYDLLDGSFSYPDMYSWAIMYQPPGRIPTRFVGQVEFESWDQSILIYKIGVEHMILNRYAMRYGFCVFPDYTERAIWTTNLTLGFGMRVGRYSFDIGYGYGKRDYLDSDFATFDVGTNYKFDETTHNFLISTGLSF